MLKICSQLRKISAFLVLISIILAGSSCSVDKNPINSELNNKGNTELQILELPVTDIALDKIVSKSKLIYASEGGTLSLNRGVDFRLIDKIKKMPFPATTWFTGIQLYYAYPLSAKVLESICENEYVRGDYFMTAILLQNSPLRKCVLDKMIENHFILNSHFLKMILIASSPLPQSIINELSNIGLNKYEIDCVLQAQSGQRKDELLYNNSGGGLRMNFYIPPYSLDQDTYISMEMDNERLMGEVNLTFNPDGTVFNPPALLDIEVSGLDFTGIDPELVNIYYDNPDTGEWEIVPSKNIIIDTETGYILIDDAEFIHFSRYAIGLR